MFSKKSPNIKSIKGNRLRDERVWKEGNVCEGEEVGCEGREILQILDSFNLEMKM